MAGRAVRMAQPWMAASILLAIIAVAAAAGKSGPPRRSKEKFVELNFFVHDDLLVANSSAFFVVPPLAGIPKEIMGHSLFGGVVVLDDLITAGPQPDSLAIGRAKGLYVLDNNDDKDPSVEFVVTAVFNEASGFPGSTISYRGYLGAGEISISGGTYKFRLARGWAEVSLYSGKEFAAVFNVTSSVYYGGF